MRTKKELIRELEKVPPDDLERGIIQHLGGGKITGKELLEELKKPETELNTTATDVFLSTLRKKLEQK